MWTKALLLGVALSAAGCRETIVVLDADGGIVSGDMRCSSADLATPPARCKAAVGLPGDTITCIDFDQVTSVTDSKLTGWFFGKDTMSRDCWEVSAGKLQVVGFKDFASNCAFTLPAFNINTDPRNYQRVTLAAVYRVHLNAQQQQKAQVMLGLDDESTRLLDWMTGVQPRKQWVQTLNRADVPAGVFQPLFKLTSSVGPGSGYQGWQIESIAVLGQQ